MPVLSQTGELQKITVPPLLKPEDFAALTQVSLSKAREIFACGVYPTVRIGRRRRMTWTTFQKHFLEKEV